MKLPMKMGILKRKRFVPLYLICCLVLTLPGCSPTEEHQIVYSLSSAEDAYIRMDAGRSRQILEHVMKSDSSSAEEKSTAARRLAEQEWLFYKDFHGAIALLDFADSIGTNPWEEWRAKSRICRENSQYPEAYAAAEHALAAAVSESERLESKISLAETIHDQCIEMIKRGNEPDHDLLDKARGLLVDVLSVEPGQPNASSFLLGVSLMRHDGPDALRAWRYYFLIPESGSAKNILAAPGGILHSILPQWKTSLLAASDRIRLITALGQSRFYSYASIVASDPRYKDNELVQKDSTVRAIVLYANFLTQVRSITEEYYRRIALGKNDETSFKRQFEAACAQLWNRLSPAPGTNGFDHSKFDAEMLKRFGMELHLGTNGNYNGYDIILGHRVSDESHTIDLYGYRATVHFIEVDFMTANGYSSWFWNGRQAIGGWGTDSAIVQIRESYIPSAYHHWKQVSDPAEREQEEELIRRERTKDDSIARSSPYAFLPGLTGRMQFEADARLYESLKSKGYTGPELCVAFVSEFLALQLEESIFAHEGRHAIDQQFFPIRWEYWGLIRSDEPEYRAKLSQVVFSSDPKFALANGGIFDRGIGQDTPHGKANERIMHAIVDWMAGHTNEITGLDRTRPLLPQFDLLSSEQIRTIFKAIDPLSGKSQ